MEHRLPHNLNISFAYVEGEIAADGDQRHRGSSGSACTSATLEPSYVLKALGVGDDLAHSRSASASAASIPKKKSITWPTSVIEVVRKLRELSPLYEMAKEGIDLSKVQWAAH